MQYPTVSGPSYPSLVPVNPIDDQNTNSRMKRSREGEEENPCQERPRLVVDKVRFYTFQAKKVMELFKRCCGLLTAEELGPLLRNVDLTYSNNVTESDGELTEAYLADFYNDFLASPLKLIHRKLPQDQPALVNECNELINTVNRIDEVIVHQRFCAFLNTVEPLLRR